MMEALPYVETVVHVGGHADEQSLAMTRRQASGVALTVVVTTGAARIFLPPF